MPPKLRALRPLLLPPLVAVGMALLFLGVARGVVGSFAFPLDDAWIHQSYARTVAESGQWAFRAGEPSSGSTAPLWTLLLVPGHWLRAPVAWSHAVGIMAWLATVGAGWTLSFLLFGSQRIAGWTALALAAEWHLAWAAVSGMEIPLYAALALALWALFLTRPRRPWLWGLLAGALTLTRPEGLLIPLLISLHEAWAGRRGWRDGAGTLLRLWLGWSLVVAPYLAFNWQVSGTPFPNTFYAKQQEYAALLAAPLWERLLAVAWQPWIGGQALCLLALPWLRARRLRGAQWLPLLWALSVLALYALRLPVTYQHGRYAMPAIPVFVLYGVAALAAALRHAPRWLRRPLAASVATAWLAFAGLGAWAYGQDVALIECEMGGAAAWVAANSRPDDLIAAHDIGRLGYTTRRPLLDFAGLISPETIPILRDEGALLALAERRGARYVVTFADWYPTMVQDPRLRPRFATRCAATEAAGGLPMTVYVLGER